MSVINKMLRDLDANKQQPESNYTQNTSEGARPTGVIASQSPRQVRLSSVILVGSIIIVLGVAIGVAWWLGLAMGKQNAALSHIINLEHDFNRLQMSPKTLAGLLKTTRTEQNELIKLVG